jgi:hypothetical protein
MAGASVLPIHDSRPGRLHDRTPSGMPRTLAGASWRCSSCVPFWIDRNAESSTPVIFDPMLLDGTYGPSASWPVRSHQPARRDASGKNLTRGENLPADETFFPGLCINQYRASAPPTDGDPFKDVASTSCFFDSASLTDGRSWSTHDDRSPGLTRHHHETRHQDDSMTHQGAPRPDGPAQPGAALWAGSRVTSTAGKASGSPRGANCR